MASEVARRQRISAIHPWHCLPDWVDGSKGPSSEKRSLHAHGQRSCSNAATKSSADTSLHLRSHACQRPAVSWCIQQFGEGFAPFAE